MEKNCARKTCARRSGRMQPPSMCAYAFIRLTSRLVFFCFPYSLLGVYTRIVSWAVHLATYHNLSFLVLENVSTIVNIPAGAVSDFISATIAFLTSALPNWHFDVKTINTKSYSLPQHRERVFLCGARRDFFLAVPEDDVWRFAWFALMFAADEHRIMVLIMFGQ